MDFEKLYLNKCDELQRVMDFYVKLLKLYENTLQDHTDLIKAHQHVLNEYKVLQAKYINNLKNSVTTIYKDDVVV